MSSHRRGFWLAGGTTLAVVLFGLIASCATDAPEWQVDQRPRAYEHVCDAERRWLVPRADALYWACSNGHDWPVR